VTTAAPVAPATTPPARAGLRRWAVRISSPWVSITLLVLVFIHQALGSAYYEVRQALELNEMHWFNGWVSGVLWGTICVCLLTASAVRIPWRWSRFGAHLTHLSVVGVVVTAGLYFAYKIEGEALLVRHYIDVTTAGGTTRLLPNPGYAASAGDLTAKVEAVMPKWRVQSDGGTAKDAQEVWAVMVKIDLPPAAAATAEGAPKDAKGTSFTATLLEGRPELTQYTLDGRTPTSWLPEFQSVVVDQDRIWALDGSGAKVLETALVLKGKATEKLAQGERSLEITGITPDWPLLADGFKGQKGTMVAWTIKSAGGQESGSAIVGQPTLTRFQRARIKALPDARVASIVLAPAKWTTGYHQDLPALWVRTDTDRDDPALAPMRNPGTALPIPDLPRYRDHGTHLAGGKALAIALGTVGTTSYAITGFTPYANLEKHVIDDPTAPLAPTLDLVLSSENGGQSFPLKVHLASDPGAFLDQPLVWLRLKDAAAVAEVKQALLERFPPIATEKASLSDEEAAQTRLVFAEAPGGALTLWIGEPQRNLQELPIAIGSDAVGRWSNDRIRVRLKARVDHPREVTEPVPVPEEQQQSRMSVGSFQSLVQVTATTGGPNPASVSTWVPYTPFPHLPQSMGDGSGTLGGYASRPTSLSVPGVGDVELAFSREPLALPGPIWMTGFDAPRRPGGQAISEYLCDVQYGKPGQTTPDAATIHMNYPLAWDGLFFFQANWDPEFQALTVLGVGNRPAGAALLAAAILLAIGMAWSGLAMALSKRSA
jgi:hypothetical protein